MAEYNSLDDLKLIDLLKGGDEAAFGEIYHRYAESLAGFAGSKLYDLEDARDIIQDLFVKLWEEREQLNIDRNLKGFLFNAVRFRIIDKIRKNIVREEFSGMLQALDVSYELATEQNIAAKELQQHIDKALGTLSPRVREIYHLSREENLSTREIADQLNLSEQTVKNQLTHALKHVRQSLTCISVPTFLFWLFS